MKDLYKEISKYYKQTETKKLLLNPGLKRALPKSKRKGNLLDIGCGIGDFSEIAEEFNYYYYGLDISNSMLARAKGQYPSNNFKLLSATKFAHKYKLKFDVVIINMVLLSFNSKIRIKKCLSETKNVLQKNGLVIIGIPNPSFDHYMRAGLFGKKNVKTQFKGYFKSGQKYILRYKFNNHQVNFLAYHWTLKDYFDVFIKLGFRLISTDECPPRQPKISNLKFKEKNLYPTYLVITLK